MEVKCPKCRLRFDVTTAPGINEVQCNCPRCGTPFTYTLMEENGEGSDGQEHKTDDAINAEDKNRKSKDRTSTSTTRESSSKGNDGHAKSFGKDVAPSESDNKGVQDYYKKHLLDVRGPLVMQEQYRHHSNRHTYLLLAGIIAMLLLAGVFAKGIDMFISHFTDDDRILSEKLAVDTSLITRKDTDSTKVKEKEKGKKRKGKREKAEKKAKKEDGKEKAAEAMPRWLQGKWHLYTAKGYITMNIKGSSIVVSDGFHTNEGTVHCKGNVMVCKYHDGRTFTYNLDPKGHRIIVEFGMELTKTK